VIIFSCRAPIAAIGGVENSIRNLVSVACKKDLQVMVVCSRAFGSETSGKVSFEMPEKAELLTYADEYRLNPVNRLCHLSRGGQTLLNLYKALFLQYPNALVITRHHAHALAACSAGFERVHYLVPSLTTQQLRKELQGVNLLGKIRIGLHIIFDGIAQRQALEKARLFVFSELMRKDLREALFKAVPTEITLVKPGIDRSLFSTPTRREKFELKRNLNLSVEHSYFLFVGRFVRAKGLDYFIEAMTYMPVNSRAVLLGDGEHKLFLERKIAALRLQDRLTVLDPTLEVMHYYRACDVFVMSSTYEPLGQTLLEAVACGMRVAAFDPATGVRTATKELLIDHAVEYATELSSAGLASAMAKALQKESIIRTALKNEEFYERYSWERLLQQLIQS